MPSFAEVRALIEDVTVGLAVAVGLWWLATQKRDVRGAATTRREPRERRASDPA